VTGIKATKSNMLCKLSKIKSISSTLETKIMLYYLHLTLKLNLLQPYSYFFSPIIFLITTFLFTFSAGLQILRSDSTVRLIVKIKVLQIGTQTKIKVEGFIVWKTFRRIANPAERFYRAINS